MAENYIIYKSTDKGNEFFDGFMFEGTENQLVAEIKQVIEVKEKKLVQRMSELKWLHGLDNHRPDKKYEYKWWACGVTFKDGTNDAYRVEQREIQLD